MAEIKFEINDDGIRKLYEEVATNLKRIDSALRQELTGRDVDVVIPRVKAALGASGVELPDDKLREYSQSISENKDFKFVLT